MNQQKTKNKTLTKYALTVNDLLTGHHDVFGISEHHSYPPELQILATEPWMFQLRIAKISHVQLDQNFAVLAKTIGSKNLMEF
jgi:hypothetical protein